MEAKRLEGDRLSPDKAREVVATARGQTIDVRDQEEYARGHIPGSINIPADELEQRVDELSDDGPVIVVCDSGKRSAEAAGQLRERGYEAASIEGGMSAWSSDKLPLQPAEDEEFHGPRRPGPLGA